MIVYCGLWVLYSFLILHTQRFALVDEDFFIHPLFQIGKWRSVRGIFYCASNWLKMRKDELWRADTRDTDCTHMRKSPGNYEKLDHLFLNMRITTGAESSQSRSIKISIKLLFICKIYFDVRTYIKIFYQICEFNKMYINI